MSAQGLLERVLKAANRLRFPTLGCFIRMLSWRICGRYRILAGRHPALPGQADKWLLPVLRVGLVIGVSGNSQLTRILHQGEAVNFGLIHIQKLISN